MIYSEIPGKKNLLTSPVAMPNRILKIIMNGVTGRMGRAQHLARSIVAIRQQGGLQLRNGETLWPEPILVGRNERRLRSLAEEHGLTLWTTDLQEALSDPDAEIYFDTQVTSERASAVKAAIAAGKHIYCEKPVADDLRAAKELAELASSAGVKNGVVQDKLFLPGLRKLKALVENGFFPAATTAQERIIWEENKRAVDEAAALGAEVLVLVCGGIVNHDLDRSREMVVQGIDRLLPYAEKIGVKLGIEPLHPMFAADRSVIVSVGQANAIVDMFKSSNLGTVIDVYHVWWDPVVYSEITRSSGHIFGFHVNDWIVPVPDILNGRGMMGDGVIPIKRLREAVSEAGYSGAIEVEIFNEELWRLPGSELLQLVKDRFLKVV
jgi:sugar phosphate isomerase/epimerase